MALDILVTMRAMRNQITKIIYDATSEDPFEVQYPGHTEFGDTTYTAFFGSETEADRFIEQTKKELYGEDWDIIPHQTIDARKRKPMNLPPKEYLGDAVYADFDGYHIVLTCNDGIHNYETIALDPHVVENLKAYIQKVEECTA